MPSSDSYSVFQLNNSGSIKTPSFTVAPGGPIAVGANLTDETVNSGKSANVLGDQPNDTFQVTGYFDSPATSGGSDAITDDGGLVPLDYLGYISTSVGGVTYTAAVGYDTDTGNYFLFVPTTAGAAAAFEGASNLPLNKDNPATGANEWLINQEAPFCFLAETMLLTPTGERAVETLKAGDLVLTASGAAKPVRWIGRTVVATKFADKARMMPVRIGASALAENVPSRDLLVSPGHAVMVDGLLIHASALVNGTSIVQETDMPLVFTYYHVETDAHDLLVAENTPAESFLEAVADIRLDNFPERGDLDGPSASVEMDMPRVKAARQVPVHVRAAIAARTAQLSAGDRLAA